MFKKDRAGNAGGVLIAVSDQLVRTEEPDLSRENCEIIWVRVKSKGRRSLLIGAYYRRYVGDEASLRALSQSAEKACKSRTAIVLLGGDFNFPGWDWGSMTPKKGTPYPKLHHLFVATIRDLGLKQIVDKPTKEDNTLDLICTNFPDMIPRVETLSGLADHGVMYAELQLNPVRARPTKRRMPATTELTGPE